MTELSAYKLCHGVRVCRMGHSIHIRAKNITATTEQRGELSSGIYIARLATSINTQSIKMVLLK